MQNWGPKERLLSGDLLLNSGTPPYLCSGQSYKLQIWCADGQLIYLNKFWYSIWYFKTNLQTSVKFVTDSATNISGHAPSQRL